MRFKSKIDAWLVMLLFVSLLLAPVIIIAAGSRAGHAPINGAVLLLIGFVAVAPVAAIVAWIFSTTDYTLTNTDLLVRSGPMKWTVALASIRKITATRSILSAPALSLDRLEIAYGNYDAVVISPDDKQAFVNEVVRRVPGVVVAGIDR